MTGTLPMEENMSAATLVHRVSLFILLVALGIAGLPSGGLAQAAATATVADTPTADNRLDDAQARADALAERLAESEGRVDELVGLRDDLQNRLGIAEAELASARDDVARQRDQVEALASDLDAQRSTLDELAASRDALSVERDRLVERVSELEDETEMLRQREADALLKASSRQTEIVQLRSELKVLSQRTIRLDAEVSELRESASESATRAGALEEELATLRAGLPSRLGGSASLPELRQAAAELAGQMREMHARLRRQPDDESLHQAYDAASRELGDVQLKIAGETDAAGIYRLQPTDTLSALAHRHMLNGNWRVIYDNNRYVLDDPDRVIAGLTLVMP